MTEQQKQLAKKEIKVTDLSLSNLITMPYKQLKKQVLGKKEDLGKIANDDRHLRVLIFRMLYENNCAIKNFNKSSTCLSCMILLLVIVQVILAIYK